MKESQGGPGHVQLPLALVGSVKESVFRRTEGLLTLHMMESVLVDVNMQGS